MEAAPATRVVLQAVAGKLEGRRLGHIMGPCSVNNHLSTLVGFHGVCAEAFGPSMVWVGPDSDMSPEDEPPPDAVV